MVVVIHPPKKKATTPRYDWVVVWMWAFYQIFVNFGYYIPICTLQVIALDVSVEFHCLLVEHIKPVEAWDSPSAETPSGSPILSHHSSPFVTSCRAEQRGEILGGHSKDTEVWEAQVVWDVVCVTVYRAWLLYCCGSWDSWATLGWVVWNLVEGATKNIQKHVPNVSSNPSRPLAKSLVATSSVTPLMLSSRCLKRHLETY